MTEAQLLSCSKTLAYFMRHAVQKFRIRSYKVNGMVGFFDFQDMRKRVEGHLRRYTFSTKDLLYTVANNDGQRFEIYIEGPDPEEGSTDTRIYIRPAAGQSEIYDERGNLEES